jgi:hypothetical protein
LPVVIHIDSHDLELYVREKLDAERSSIIQSHVQICSVCRSKLVGEFLARLGEVNQKQPGTNGVEKRAERRFQSGESGFMQTLCPLSLEQAAVQVLNVSKDGFGLLVGSFVATGTIVQIRIGTAISVGTVRSCRATSDGQFHAGIRVQRSL